jgi:hypothetical protein
MVSAEDCLPNIPGGGFVNNYLCNGALINNIDQGDLRMDYRTTNSAIFGRFSASSTRRWQLGIT